jgi:acyl transferase domain-containing protein
VICKDPKQHLLIARTEGDLKEEFIENVTQFYKSVNSTEFLQNNNSQILEGGPANSEYQLAVHGRNRQQVLEQLELDAVRECPNPKERPKVAFLFTGQGSQYGGMARDLYKTSTVFRSAFDQSSALLQNELPVSLKDVIWGDNTVLLEESLYSQTGIFCIEYAYLQLWKSLGLEPDFVLGPSAGAFCASVAAGILSFEDALKLVTGRGKLIQDLPTGGMTSVKGNNTYDMKQQCTT